MRLFFLLVVLFCAHGAQAQVYRCGSSYSHAPCPGAIPVETSPSLSQPGGAATDTITLYLCQTYGGGKFWTRDHCAKRSALVDRMESVPATLPFEQQVEMAQGQRSKAQALTASLSQTVQSPTPVTNLKATCEALEARIRYLDQMARSGGNAQYMDWVAAERKKARDQQFRLRC